MSNFVPPADPVQGAIAVRPNIFKRGGRAVRRRVQRFLAVRNLYLTENDRHLAALKNRHQGQRCFVIGNGPSLTIADLDRLGRNQEVTIASNKIYLAFDATDWRPTYYTVADWLVAESSSDHIRGLDLVKLFPEALVDFFGPSQAGGNQGRHIYFRFLKQTVDSQGIYTPQFSTDALVGFEVGQTVTGLNIQLAYYLGCNPIYLIGIDGTYQLPETKAFHHQYKQVLVAQQESNHFHPNYRQPGEKWSIPDPEAHEAAYQFYRDFLAAHDVKIYNASRQSVVRAFERVDLDSIL
ncbi:MAG: 6-hydroxymethylpterin diphosphokinase MptE-like protein [Anaerolineae bacterium]|nr:6-hydroxymethylpterin diphosphokinase MptE-like protein [Anaerolineae bacterium]